ncbi:SLOG family protein [Laspinema palackyanum]|uniref:SLOG family protein n=1 Tax=Laspinema palackyanum TaxID=3231601 RepID=UPI00348C236A|nr:DUF1273 domain-containing protein [Laspinema sp. D2c]
MELIREKTAAFTGHRQFAATDIFPVQIALQRMIDRAKERGFDSFISGMAIGVDQWAAGMVADDPDLRLIAAIPCKEQYKKWPKSSQRYYFHLLEKADSVHYLSHRTYFPGCMNDRNKWMVDRCSLVLSVWDGRSGGTCHAVEYALDQGITVVNFDPVSASYKRLHPVRSR